MNKHYDSIHFKHEDVFYVPCFQKNPQDEKDGYPTFTYDLSQASSDPQMAASFNPDYILILKGQFDAKTQPFNLEILNYNRGTNE